MPDGIQTPVDKTDFNLALPSELLWEKHKENVDGSVDVIGTRNGKFLVNVRGTIPDELKPYNLDLDTPLRMWA